MQRDLETGGPLGQVGNWVLQLFLFLLPKGRGVSLVQTDISWEGEASPWLIVTFWEHMDLLQPALHLSIWK
jgi:hypothetical protein